MTEYRHIARRVLATEIDALNTLSETLDPVFDQVVDLLKDTQGRIILAGVGKSGHVARKISATMASTGTSSLYVHPTEASHGDMGMIAKGDTVIALSRSGETQELADVIGYCRRFSIPLVAMTVNAESTLGRSADYVLKLPDAPEACAETRAPTTSTTLQIALGDALSIALLEAKGFTAKDFKTYHPGGALGASLATTADLMHGGDIVPLVNDNVNMQSALEVMSAKGFGCVGIVNGNTLVGIITDGDIRRHLAADLGEKPVTDVMTADPQTAAPGTLAADTLRRMTGGQRKIMQMFVVEDGKTIGIVHLHDFLRAGLI